MRLAQGDIVKLDLDPTKGHEQAGYRPAVVVSGGSLNDFSKIRVICPITNTIRNYPAHIPLDKRTKTTGVVMCDQVRTIDPAKRNITVIEKIPQDILRLVLDTIVDIFD